jgi:hypothetical protein
MPPVGFEPTILVSERPKTHALDRAATGIGNNEYIIMFKYVVGLEPRVCNFHCRITHYHASDVELSSPAYFQYFPKLACLECDTQIHVSVSLIISPIYLQDTGHCVAFVSCIFDLFYFKIFLKASR